MDRGEVHNLIDEAALWNGGWLNGPAYTRWRAEQRAKGRAVPSHQHLSATGINLIRTIKGLGIPTHPPAVPDDELLDIVRQANQEAEMDGLSIAAYRHWRADHPEAPTVKAFVKRFGSWQAALERAEVDAVSGNRSYSDADLIEALRRAADALGFPGGAPSMNAYEAWRQANGAPAAVTIFNRFGSWSDAIATFGNDPNPR